MYCCKLHDEELHNSQSSPDTTRTIKSRRMRFAGHVARIEGFVFSNTEGKRPLRRRKSRLEDNIKIDLQETGWKILDCIHLA